MVAWGSTRTCLGSGRVENLRANLIVSFSHRNGGVGHRKQAWDWPTRVISKGLGVQGLLVAVWCLTLY